MMISTRALGTIVEYQCATALMELGCVVSFPLGDFAKYDLICDYHGHLLRLQVKHATATSDRITFHCESTQINRTRVEFRRYTKDDIDYFCTFSFGKCYLVPVNECGTYKSLRLTPTRNNASQGISWAADYEASVMLTKLISV